MIDVAKAPLGAMAAAEGLPEGTLADEVAFRVAAALAGDGPSMSDLVPDLDAALDALLWAAPQEARAVAQGSTSRTADGVAAYALGQVAFARRLVAHVVLRGADDALRDACSDPLSGRVMRSLGEAGRDLAGVSADTGLPVREVDRIVRVLVGAGAVVASADFGLDGFSVTRRGRDVLHAAVVLRSPS